MRSDTSVEWLSPTAALEAVSVSVGASAALSMAAASRGSASAANSDNRRLRSAVYCRPRRSLYDRLARACEWEGVDAIGCGGEIRISHRAAPCRNVMQMRATWVTSIASDADSNGTAWVILILSPTMRLHCMDDSKILRLFRTKRYEITFVF
jgi:hypothetical protein